MIQVLERAMHILELVGSNSQGYTVIQIAEQLGLNRGTCSTIVRSLAEESYVVKLKKTRNYILGPRVYGLTRRRYFLNELVMPAKPVIDELSRKTGYPCVLAVIFQDRYHLLYTTKQEQGIPRDDELVFLEDVSPKATGRMLMSGMDAPGLERFLKENPATGRNWPEADDMAGTLKQIRKNGCAVINDTGYAALAVPVRNINGAPVALGMYMPQEAYTAAKEKEFIGMMQERAIIISREYDRSN